MKSLCLVVCLMLMGCASEPRKFWTRSDGGPVIARQFEVDRTICRGESQKANASGTVIAGGGGLAGALAGAAAVENRSEALADVYVGCMAQRGYLVKPDCPPSAKGDCVLTFRPGETYKSE
jgi:hypothetical protein